MVHGATLRCSEGVAPSTLTTLPANRADAELLPAATVADFLPMVNIAPFGACRTLANPAVAAATAAAMGALTPAPCTPVVVNPWSSGAEGVTIAEQTALTSQSTCSCAWSGTIEVTEPGCDVDVG